MAKIMHGFREEKEREREREREIIAPAEAHP
jgi:hypothetical protein